MQGMAAISLRMDLGLPAGEEVIVLFMAERYSILYLSPQKTEEKSFVKKFVMHPMIFPEATIIEGLIVPLQSE
jgi:hypothetical protein